MVGLEQSHEPCLDTHHMHHQNPKVDAIQLSSLLLVATFLTESFITVNFYISYVSTPEPTLVYIHRTLEFA